MQGSESQASADTSTANWRIQQTRYSVSEYVYSVGKYWIRIVSKNVKKILESGSGFRSPECDTTSKPDRPDRGFVRFRLRPIVTYLLDCAPVTSLNVLTYLLSYLLTCLLWKVQTGGGGKQFVDIDGSRVRWSAVHHAAWPGARLTLSVRRTVAVLLFRDRIIRWTTQWTSPCTNAR